MPPLATDMYHEDPIIGTYPSCRQGDEHNERKVHFQPWVNFVTIPNISHYSKQEIESTWYSPDELCPKRRNSRKSRDVSHRQEMIHSAREAVLAEQNLDVHKEGELADVYLNRSRSSQSEAVERARCQAQDVRLLEFFQW